MKIVVIGEDCLDLFEYGTCTRLNPEAPTPVFVSEKIVQNGGMARNVYNNLFNMMPAEDIAFVYQEEGEIVKHRFVDKASNYILLRVDKDGPPTKLTLQPRLKDLITSADFVVVSDYDKGFLDTAVLREISNLAKVSFIDTKKALGQWAECFSWIKINRKEFSNPNHDPVFMEKYSDRIIVTLGELGARIGNTEVRSEKRVEVKDVSGAGDTFLAGLVYKFSTSLDIIDSIKYANLCAGEAVSHKGVVSVGKIV